jgi:nuclear pore complex protein Nup205
LSSRATSALFPPRVVLHVSAMESLERLQGLHADLVAFSETRLINIDRLSQELEDSIQDFKNLLDKAATAASDRDAYNNGARWFL